MTGNEPAAEPSPPAASKSWREHAVSRSLDSARLRAEKRVQRFLDAALELMSSDSGREFTVQEVVERSGQSLRSFYQYFAGKHELLLALFEESVRSTAEQLREEIAKEDAPLDRLHRFAIEYYELCHPVPRDKRKKRAPTWALAEFAQQLLTDHPKEASVAFVPLVTLLEEVLDEAATAGAIRPGLHHRRLAGVILQAIMFHVFSATISGTSVRADGTDAAEEMWDLLLQGIATDTAS
jgi:AcrR family transcriptional regulator